MSHQAARPISATAFSNFTVPFLGLYAAATGHGFFADVLVRHDFWRGEVTSAGAATDKCAEWTARETR